MFDPLITNLSLSLFLEYKYGVAQVRLMCVDVHKSGNDYKKRATQQQMP